jgi:rubredoxin
VPSWLRRLAAWLRLYPWWCGRCGTRLRKKHFRDLPADLQREYDPETRRFFEAHAWHCPVCDAGTGRGVLIF